MKKEIRTKNAPMPAGPYSQGIIVDNRIYVAGQGPLNPATGKVPEGIEEQTRQVLKNIQAILEAGGAKLDDVVKVTAHLADLKYFTAFNEVYKTFFKEPFPVRTTVGSQLKDILVEIDVIAELA
ncbi:MAG: Rid family detoxifying hydrolase [Synergistota bacterium]|nr:Rid family detoxifying hydrolase [Synergistota bacterium]HHV53781.1 RidA family protein [Synergistaceae bacterium]